MANETALETLEIVKRAREDERWLDSDKLFNALLEVTKDKADFHVLYPCVGYSSSQKNKGEEKKISFPDANTRLGMLQSYVTEENGALSDIQNKHKNIIPYHPHGNHWCIFILEPNEKELSITCFDPFGGNSAYRDENKKAMDLLRDLLKGNKKCNEAFNERQFQNDSHSCGDWCKAFVQWAIGQENVYEAVQKDNNAYINSIAYESEVSKKEVERLKDIDEIAFTIAKISMEENVLGNAPKNEGVEYNNALIQAEEIYKNGLTKELVGNKDKSWEELIKEQHALLSKYKPCPGRSSEGQIIS